MEVRVTLLREKSIGEMSSGETREWTFHFPHMFASLSKGLEDYFVSLEQLEALNISSSTPAQYRAAILV